MGFSGGLGLILVAVAVTSLAAVFISVRTSLQSRRNHRHNGLEKRLRDAEIELVSMADQLDSLAIIAKKKYSRDAVRETRRRKAEKLNGEESDEDWKQRMTREHALGGRTI